jgi:hypothetical protein
MKKFILLLLVLGATISKGQESIQLRTDRNVYIAGELVWLTVNCLAENSSAPSTTSQVVYLEALNSQNVPVGQLKLKLNQGQLSTSMLLPDTLSTGNYQLRAYTQWMRNYHVDFFESTTISVINPFANKAFPKSDKTFLRDTLLFFPECGQLIAGVSNHAVIQILDSYGKGKETAYFLLSPEGDTLLQKRTNVYGFDKLILPPIAEGRYLFTFSDEQRNSRRFPLPERKSTGYGLQLVQDDSDYTLRFKLLLPDKTGNTLRKGLLHITSNGCHLKSYPVVLDKHERIQISKKDLPEGILTALLLNDQGELLASRYFTKANQLTTPGLHLSMQQQRYPQRSAVNLTITREPYLSNISVSVVKSCLVKPARFIQPNQSSISSYHSLLQWQNRNISINDLLMCYQPVGEILPIDQNSQTLFLPEMKGEIISGTVIDLQEEKPIVNQDFALSFVSKNPTIFISRTDSAGRFQFIANRYGEQEIVIQPLFGDTSLLHYDIDLDQSFSGRYSTRKGAPFRLEKDHIEGINQTIINHQINALYQPYQSYKLSPQKSPEPFCFYGPPEIEVVIDEFIDLPTMEEVIKEIVPFVFIRRHEGQRYLKVFEVRSNYPRDGETLALVDGVPIWDSERILDMHPEELDKIEVINLNYFKKGYELGRIVSIFTAQGDLSAMEFDNRIFRQSQTCYAPEYLFSGPDYSSDSIRSSKIPDFRNLLYWEPHVEFDQNNTAHVSFFTSDELTDYTIIVEGLNQSGQLERKEVSFEVK